jgi:hypothetical protein
MLAASKYKQYKKVFEAALTTLVCDSDFACMLCKRMNNSATTAAENKKYCCMLALYSLY